MSKRRKKVLNVTDGGRAFPIAPGYFLMKGRTHEQGGIGIGNNLEVEDGEIIKTNKKSLKVLSNAPIMNGISPAQMALGGLNNGTFEKRFNQGFKYQERFKDKNGLKDDGTKAQLGKNKKLIGGNEEKEFKLGELNSTFYTPKEKTFYEKTLPKVPYMPREELATLEKIPNSIFTKKVYQGIPEGFVDITEDVKNGERYLYSYPFNTIYQDLSSNKFYADKYSSHGVVDTSQLKKYTIDEFRKLLPKKDYIGGTKREVGIKIIDKLPGLKDTILSLANQYGISPDVFAQRLIYEGWLQQIASDYNRSSVANQKTFPWQDYMDNEVSGYGQLGLDTFGDHLKAGDLNLRRNIDFVDTYNTNEDGTGNKYNSAMFSNAYDALEAKAAMLEYFTNIAKKRNISEEDMNAYVNAMYNMGEYHKDLNNIDYIRKQYSFKPYYRLGGKHSIYIKPSKRGTFTRAAKERGVKGYFL